MKYDDPDSKPARAPIAPLRATRHHESPSARESRKMRSTVSSVTCKNSQLRQYYGRDIAAYGYSDRPQPA